MENSRLVRDPQFEIEAEFEGDDFEMTAGTDKVTAFELLGGVLGHDELLKQGKDGCLQTFAERIAVAFFEMMIRLDGELVDFVCPIDYGERIHRRWFGKYMAKLVFVPKGEESIA